MAYEAAHSLQYALDNLVHSTRISVSPLSLRSIDHAQAGLNHLRQVLERLDATSKSSSRKNVNALDAQIKEVIWKIQDVVECHLYDQLNIADSDQILHPEVALQELVDPEVSLQELSQVFDRFLETLKEKEEEYVSLLDNMSPEEDEEEPPPSSDSGGGRRRKFKMVGSSSDMLLEAIRSKLDFSRPVHVVPVFGMAGIGKSAVAREFFDDLILLSEFGIECRAWVSVGRKPRMIRTIKRDILNQLDQACVDRKIGERSVDYLLRGIFKAKKRCLVVLDDVWDTPVWDELESLFPGYGNGKILVLLTTRLQHLGDQIDERWTGMKCEVNLLNDDQSWALLRQRLLLFEEEEEEEECPPELIEYGKKIAQRCDGLPLMILAVAALLSEAEATAEFWEEVAESKNPPIFTAAYDQLYEVLLPSYEYLPQYLKPCFLHMGVFPQFEEITREKLFCLWVSEEFLDPMTTGDPLAMVTRELVEHSVVMVCRIINVHDIDNMKTCRLHSTFWYLCRREATAAKFCRVLTGRDDAFQELTIKGQRRLSFHNNILFAMKDVVDSVEEACASSARSLYCYGLYYPYPVPICFGLRLLKVLDACNLRFYEFPEQVVQMVYLRFLALTCNTAFSPCISRLWDLQFLIIYRNEKIKFSGEKSCVPIEIWHMRQLGYIKIEGWNLPTPPPRDEEGVLSWFLDLLDTLVGVGAETCTRKVLEKIPNLRKLGVTIELHPDADNMKQMFDHLNNIYLLSKLQKLKCVVLNPILVARNEVIPPPVSMFPLSVAKLSLSGTGYPWECMSIIGSLPNLQVLKLRCYAFRGLEWIVRYGEFESLRFLMIEGTDLVHFKVENRGLPSLRTFILENCYKLKHLLWELDPSYPISIEVFDCSPAATAFAHRMRSRYESLSQRHYQVEVQSSWE